MEVQEEIHHLLVGRGGGVKGRKCCEQNFCEQIGVSYSCISFLQRIFWLSFCYLHFFPKDVRGSALQFSWPGREPVSGLGPK